MVGGRWRQGAVMEASEVSQPLTPIVRRRRSGGCCWEVGGCSWTGTNAKSSTSRAYLSTASPWIRGLVLRHQLKI